MSAKVYHYCQACKKHISPSINDDNLRAFDQVANYNKYVSTYLSRLVLSRRCPKCGANWKPKLLYVGYKARVVRRGNYKKQQQAKSKAGNIQQVKYGRKSYLD